MIELLSTIWAYLLASSAVVASALSTYHVITTKDDVRAAIGWVGLVWLVPVGGAIIYFLFGVNRIRRKAIRVYGSDPLLLEHHSQRDQDSVLVEGSERLPENVREHLRLMTRLSEHPLTAGNQIRPLVGGIAAYDTMIAAIDAARTTVALQTYIFTNDVAGKRFIEALGRAVERGVECLVLVDGLGEFYGLKPVTRALRKKGVKVAHFNRSWMPWRMGLMNLRNHRKILVVDGMLGFSGGMNIRAGHIYANDRARAVKDIHFEVRGPVVQHLANEFMDDWAFATKEALDDGKWAPEQVPVADGMSLARGIADGPDNDVDIIRWALMSAVHMARRSVRIVTPYFLPDRLLSAALNQAALRGVTVDIVLPEKNNLPPVGWAAVSQYEQVLKGGCRIYHSPPPFDHSKIVIIDDAWVLFGSSNWDPRSLRLNFEFNVECIDDGLASQMGKYFEGLKAGATQVTLETVRARGALRTLRDGLCWLLMPYL